MNSATPRIDAHQHYWSLARGDYRWLSPRLVPLYRDYGPRDLAPELERAGIAGTILVQAADSIDETRYLLALAERTPSVRGVVGWIDLAASSAAVELAALARDARLVGLRPMLQDLALDTWVLQPAVVEVLRALPQSRLCFDALVKPRHLPVVAQLLERIPELDLVVDHAGKPRIGSARRRWDGFENWRAGLARIAAHPRAHCKLSGLLTEAEADADAGELARVVETVLELFGPERCLWGSDWPVLQLVSDYSTWFERARTLLARLDAREREAVLGANALNFYRRAQRSPAATLAASRGPNGVAG
jgi:L-fuconolactonase